MEEEIKETYYEAGTLIERLEFRDAVKKIMSLVEEANKYYDTMEPWKAKNEDINKFNNVIYTCSVIIANLSNLFEPIMPSACKKIRTYLNLPEKPIWNFIDVKPGLKLENIEPLFTRIDKKNK